MKSADAIVPWWKCPCGCSLQLSSRDVANERRLIAQLGPEPRYVTLRTAGESSRFVPETPEPTTKGECRNCGAAMELFTYLAESLKLRGAPWPFCDLCMQAAKIARAA